MTKTTVWILSAALGVGAASAARAAQTPAQRVEAREGLQRRLDALAARLEAKDAPEETRADGPPRLDEVRLRIARRHLGIAQRLVARDDLESARPHADLAERVLPLAPRDGASR